MESAQAASHVIALRPAAFRMNSETRATNPFQGGTGAAPRTPAELQRRALEEFDAMVDALKRCHIRLTVLQDSPDSIRPDAIFPNNWFSTHRDGTLVLYPMSVPSRRRERRPELIEAIQALARTKRVLDLTHFEKQNLFLEGTGSMVLDRAHRILYAALSPRTQRKPLDAFATELNYDVEVFHALDHTGGPLYHTNIMLSIGHDAAVICADAIPDRKERTRILDRLSQDGSRAVHKISFAHMRAFAGNILHVLDDTGKARWLASARAARALRAATKGILSIAPVPDDIRLETIETYGGGSLRCMLAEIFPSPE